MRSEIKTRTSPPPQSLDQPGLGQKPRPRIPREFSIKTSLLKTRKLAIQKVLASGTFLGLQRLTSKQVGMNRPLGDGSAWTPACFQLESSALARDLSQLVGPGWGEAAAHAWRVALGWGTEGAWLRNLRNLRFRVCGDPGSPTLGATPLPGGGLLGTGLGWKRQGR